VLCLLCVTPLVCSSYSSFVSSSPFFSSWWQKDCELFTQRLVLQCCPSTSSCQPQTTHVFANSRIGLLCHVLRICVAHALPESCPFSPLVHWTFRDCYRSHLPLLHHASLPQKTICSKSAILYCISAQTLHPATTCSCCSLYQVWQTWAYSLMFVQLACWHTDVSRWSGGQPWRLSPFHRRKHCWCAHASLLANFQCSRRIVLVPFCIIYSFHLIAVWLLQAIWLPVWFCNCHHFSPFMSPRDARRVVQILP